MITLLLVTGCAPTWLPGGDGVVPASTAAATASSGSGSGPVAIHRVRFWEWTSLPPELQAEVLAVIKGSGDIPGESNMTAAFEPGSVSGGLGLKIVQSWRQGQARTVATCVTGKALVPGMAGWQGFSACPGQNPKSPRETYIEWKLPRGLAFALADPTFEVIIEKPPECDIVYWQIRKSGGQQGRLSTRTTADSGQNEVMRALNAGSEGISMNFILACRKKGGG